MSFRHTTRTLSCLMLAVAGPLSLAGCNPTDTPEPSDGATSETISEPEQAMPERPAGEVSEAVQNAERPDMPATEEAPPPSAPEAMAETEKAKPESERDWLIIPGERVGKITAETTEADLIALYGAEHVADEEVYLGEGYSEMGTGVFLADEGKTLRILWYDPEKKAKPASVQLAGAKSVWKTAEGITLGTPLTKFQELNGKPFKLFGFEWDYGGTLSDGNGGDIKGLAHEDPEKGFQPAYLSLTFQPDYEGKPDFPQEKLSQVSGDAEFSSDHPVMQELDPVVYSINVSFPEPAE